MTETKTGAVPHLGYAPDCEYLGDQPAPPAGEDQNRARLTSALVATVVFLTAIAPLATDMYVPAFPQVAGELVATATQVQLTLTTFFVGMALGQLIGGPVSDQRGRRGLLIAAVAVMTVASVMCALAPAIGVMMYPECGEFEWVPGPEYSQLMNYVHTGRNRPVKLYRSVDQRFILEDMFAKLARFARGVQELATFA